jgi:L-amino acid N-acyltransferase YncA
MEIRPLDTADQRPLVRFFERIPLADRAFFREDVFAEELFDRWAGDRRARRLVAVDESDEIRGYVAVLPGLGRSDHLGEIRLVVDPSARRQGLGRALARRIVLEALALGLRTLYVEVVAEQTALISMFQLMGFEPEALLRDFVRGEDGEFHDLMLLTHLVDERWAELLTIGFGEAFT